MISGCNLAVLVPDKTIPNKFLPSLKIIDFVIDNKQSVTFEPEKGVTRNAFPKE